MVVNNFMTQAKDKSQDKSPVDQSLDNVQKSSDIVTGPNED